jgi:hypothetical protein
LDEIEEIFVILRRISNDVEAETTDFDGISAAEELKRIPGDQISDLLIRTGDGNRGIEVHLLTSTRVLVSTKDDDQLMGAFYRLQQLITSRERPFGVWRAGTFPRLNPYLGGILWLLALALIAFVINRDDPKPVDGDGVPVLAVAISVILGLLIVALAASMLSRNLLPEATVVLKRKAKPPTFWERHRTAILHIATVCLPST